MTTLYVEVKKEMGMEVPMFHLSAFPEACSSVPPRTAGASRDW